VTYLLTYGDFLDFVAERRPPVDDTMSSRDAGEQLLFTSLLKRYLRCFGRPPGTEDVLTASSCPCPDHRPVVFNDRDHWRAVFDKYAKKRSLDVPTGTIGGPESRGRERVAVTGLDDVTAREMARVERRASIADRESPSELSQAAELVHWLENSLDQFDLDVRDGHEIQIAMHRALADIAAGDRAPANERSDRKATGFTQLTRDHLEDLLGEVVAGDGVAERAARSRRLKRGMTHVEAFVGDHWNDLGDGPPPLDD
jgi:hypothetical protein